MLAEIAYEGMWAMITDGTDWFDYSISNNTMVKEFNVSICGWYGMLCSLGKKVSVKLHFK